MKKQIARGLLIGALFPGSVLGQPPQYNSAVPQPRSNAFPPFGNQQARPQLPLPSQPRPTTPYAAPQQYLNPFAKPVPGEFGYSHPLQHAPAPPSIRDYSWIYIDQPTEQVFRVNDIVTVLVSERSEVTLNSRFNRQRNATLVSELNEFVKLDGLFTLRNSASTSPSIDVNQQERIQAAGQVIDQEGITYRIAATVVDVRPNGNLVLEARKKIYANDDLWEYTLHGEIRYEDVLRDNTVMSENIANLNIEKRLQGRVASSTGRRWGNKIVDWLWPF